ncbi:MAG: aminodeoxychorismate/anthranilate synthase component II [Rikenellaceae bacterium]|nr:aminodeoxychorismate/anthranilate synthase component II [Rikenellaceae bacterium]
MMRILLVDNKDSFVYNICHLVKRCSACRIDIVANDNIPFNSLGDYSHIILSPGPGLPSEAGDMPQLINMVCHTHSVLGICLGHQAIASHFGARLINQKSPMHGHRALLKIIDKRDPIVGNVQGYVGLYHSWSVDSESLPGELIIGSLSERGVVMSIFHEQLPLFGLQFHPESIMSDCGEQIITNWLSIRQP